MIAIIQPIDIVDGYIGGFVSEVKREIRNSSQLATPCFISSVAEKHVISFLSHECSMENPVLLSYVEDCDPVLKKWYEENPGRYSDYFLEEMPISEPFISNPEKYANIWSNLATQMIGAVYGNIRESHD